MYFFVSVEIWLLIEALRAVLVITWIWLFSSVNDTMTNEARLKVKSFIAFFVWALINFRVRVFIRTAIIRVKLFILLNFDLSVTTSYYSIVHAIASNTEILLGLVFLSFLRIFIHKIIKWRIMLFWMMAIIWEDVSLF